MNANEIISQFHQFNEQELLSILKGPNFDVFPTVHELYSYLVLGIRGRFEKEPDDIPGLYFILNLGTKLTKNELTKPFKLLGDNMVNYPENKRHKYRKVDLEPKMAMVAGETVVYIGKGESLRERLTIYMRFGHEKEKDAPHYGGRAIWHIEGHDSLVVAWIVLEGTTGKALEARESQLIGKFAENIGEAEKEKYRYPFANWIKLRSPERFLE